VAQPRRRSSGPGFGQWIVLGGAVMVILGLTFTLGMLVGRQLARSNLVALGPSPSEAARKGSAAPASRRGGIAAETMADRVPEPTEKLTFYHTLTEPLGATGAPRSDPTKPVTVPVTVPATVPTTVKVSALEPKPAPSASPGAPAAAPALPPAATAPALPPATKAAAAPTPAAPNGWTVQVGAFKNRRQADETRQHLATAGLDAYVASVSAQDGQPRFRVRVGTYRTREEAAAVAQRLRAQKSLTAFATPR
jgi:cell division protein FtsN